MSGETISHKTYIGARVPAQQAEAFARLAKATFRSQSALLRMIITEALWCEKI